ncbi:hypothetical protein GCM10023322_68680 [Rugosimonospora acidiphila]|uniref:TadE-like protein n=1 Tax=Rugosimonospora acidiphila TaxID=556531 RepID=A0ABP9SMQ0_9ACTN
MVVESLTFVLPMAAVTFFALLQFALWGLALLGARDAADGGACDAAAYGATARDGQTSATTRLDNIAGQLLRDPRVTAARDATTAQVTVSGDSPLIHLPVGWTAVCPLERFTPGG